MAQGAVIDAMPDTLSDADMAALEADERGLSDAELDAAEDAAFADPGYVMTRDEFAGYQSRRAQRSTWEKAGELAGGVARGAAGLAGTIYEAGKGAVTRPLESLQNAPATVGEGLRRASITALQYGQTAARWYEDYDRAVSRDAGLPVEGEDLDVAFSRYLTDKGVESELAEGEAPAAGQYGTGVLGLGVGPGARPATADPAQAEVIALAADPLNVVPVGVGLQGGRVVRGAVKRGVETGAGVTEAVAGALERGRVAAGDKAAAVVERVTGVPVKRQAGVSAAITPGLTAFAAMVDPTAAAATAAVTGMPAASAGAGVVLRRTRDGAGLVRQVLRESRSPLGANRFADVAASGLANNAAIPQRYRAQMARPIGEAVESVMRRIADNPAHSRVTRTIAGNLDRPLARGSYKTFADALGGATEGAAVAGGMAALMGAEPGEIGEAIGGGAVLGGTAGGASRLLNRRGRTTADEDLDVARMLADVDRAGGDVAALSAMPHDQLAKLASMQGIVANTVDIVPLRGPEYIDNLTALNQRGATSSAGIFLDGTNSMRPRIFVNLDRASGLDAIPHEIGHALMKSQALGGALRHDIRNFIATTYGAEGVQARAREYAHRLLMAERQHAAPVEPPSTMTPAQMEWVLAGKMTLDEAAAQNAAKDAKRNAITPEMIDAKVRQLSDDSVAGGEVDPMAWAQDEIFAEQWANAAEKMDLNSIRRGMPPGGYFPDFAEGLLAAQGRILEMLGVKLDPQTGAPARGQLFADNPLLASDAKMQRRLAEYARTHRRWITGNLDADARGARIAPRGRAEEMRDSPFVRLHETAEGVRENEFLREVNGQLAVKPQKEIDAAHRSRAEQMDELRKQPMVTGDDPKMGPRRRSDGTVVVSGSKLPQQFDFYTSMPVHLRRFARQLETGAADGSTFHALYHSIGSGDTGSFKVRNLGNIEAIQREVAFFGWKLSKKNNLLAELVDVTTMRAKAMQALEEGKLGMFNNDLNTFHADLMTYLRNHAEGKPGAMTIGQDKRDAINSMLGTGTRANRAANPVAGDYGRRGVIRSFRLDRLEDLTPSGRAGWTFDYGKVNANLLPAYHGTPHTVDKFTTDKIGTGEGNQSYGWGLYFAENPKVAESYRDQLMQVQFTADGQPFDGFNPRHKAGEYVLNEGGDVAAAIKAVREQIARGEGRRAPDYLQRSAAIARGALPHLERGDFAKVERTEHANTYTVDIDVKPDELLDYDKPLAEQSEQVRAGIHRLMEERTPEGFHKYDIEGARTVKDLQMGMSLQYADPSVSRALVEVGIPGIRYLDQYSRGQKDWIARHPQGGVNDFPSEVAARAFVERNPEYTLIAPGEGSRNLVIFDDSKIRITHRNGESVTPEERANTLGNMHEAQQGAMMPDMGGEKDLIARLRGLGSRNASANEPASAKGAPDALRADDPAALAAVVRGAAAADSRSIEDQRTRRFLEESRLKKQLAGRRIDLRALGAELDTESREHRVSIETPGVVTKVTRHGQYGLAPSEQYPAESHGPFEYLDRLALQNLYFDDGAQVIGYGLTPTNELAIVTTQPFVESRRDARGRIMRPDMERDIAPYMTARGWVRSRDWLIDHSWYHPDGVVARDVRPRNFILRPDGTVAAIDLMLTRTVAR